MLKRLMPARAQAQDDTESLCDLDALEDRRVTFTLNKRERVLKPITTRVFMQFWSASDAYKKALSEKGLKSEQEENEAYLKIILSVCDDITLGEISRLSIPQKGLLITHITSKIVGRDLLADIEKKNLRPRTEKVSA